MYWIFVLTVGYYHYPILKTKNWGTKGFLKNEWVLEFNLQYPRIVKMCCAMLSRSVVPNSLRPHGLQPARLFCPWDSPGRNTGVGCHALLQGIFLTQGLNPGVLHCRRFYIIWAIREAQSYKITHYINVGLWVKLEGLIIIIQQFSNYKK